MTKTLTPTSYGGLVKMASQLTIWTLFGLLAEKLPQSPAVKKAFFEFGETLLIHHKNDHND